MGTAEVEAFLSSLAVDRQVSASTQRQALAAILFLYKEVLGLDLPCAKRWLKPGQYDRPGVLVFPPPVSGPGHRERPTIHARFVRTGTHADLFEA